jgi:hypothetical protein
MLHNEGAQKWRLYLGRACYLLSIYILPASDQRAIAAPTAALVAGASFALILVWVCACSFGSFKRVQPAAFFWLLLTWRYWSLWLPLTVQERLIAWSDLVRPYALGIICAVALALAIGTVLWARIALIRAGVRHVRRSLAATKRIASDADA